jgi:SpoIID/LytB domain protein
MVPRPARRGARQSLRLILWATTMLLVPPGRLWAPAAAAAAPLPGVYEFADAAQTLAFEGKGWGHGVGLCQWGARGRALAGQSAAAIVGAYYQGTTIQAAVAPDTAIRVLVHSGLKLAPGESPRVTGSGGSWQLDTSGAAPLQAPDGAFLELSTGDGGPRYVVKDKDGAPAGEGALKNPLVLRPRDAGTRFTLGYKPAPAAAGRPGAYYDTYRGELVLSPLDGGLETINRLGLEDYLRGVVPAEMAASWPAEALKAQTLAARSYAVAQARSRAGQRYDVDDTTRFQVYLGSNVERPNVNQIVDATAGRAIVAPGLGGRVIQAYFFSTCAGWTENNESVWQDGAPLPYLRGIQDVDAGGRPYDADAPLFGWTTGGLTTAQLEAMLNDEPATEVGRLVSLDLSERASSGRLLRIRATGSRGTKTVRPDVLMARFNRLRPPGVGQMRSTNFDLKLIPSAGAAAAEAQSGAPAVAAPAPAPQPAAPPNAPSGQAAAPPPVAAAAPAASVAEPPASRLELTQPAPPQPNGPANRYFGQTGHNVGGAFLRFFDRVGGVDVLGYPRTEELVEVGRTVQYFQRAKLEHHPEKAGTPYEVQLALLGDVLTTERRPFPATAPFARSNERVYFPETSHGLHHAFLSFWRARGGLDVFGYPISEEMPETNDDGTGRAYTVQYFQRARLEYHPELPAAYRVSIGLLGDQFLLQRNWLR